MKAVHIVPDAFQHYTYVGGRENYPSPLSHTSVCVCVYFQAQTKMMHVINVFKSESFYLI